MALIVCKACGKNVSDTANKCIHCGAELKKEQEIDKEELNIEEKKPKSMSGKFFSLDYGIQDKLETEFIKSDEKAFKYKRRIVEFKKFESIANIGFFGCLFASWIVRLLSGLDVVEIVNVEMYNLSATIFNCIMIFCVVVFVLSIIVDIVHQRSIKRLIYIKKFKKWLQEEKDIDYNASFLDDAEKKLLEQVDLKTMDL